MNAAHLSFQGNRNRQDRSAAYDFLLKFHSNSGPISYNFRDKRRSQSKIATPVTILVYYLGAVEMNT